LKHVKPLRQAVHQLDILRRFGRLRPDRFVLAGSTNSIFVDSWEPRGRAILRNSGAGQPSSKAVWRRALEIGRPDLVLDVGANYGEFIFLPDYPSGVRVVGIEANPSLFGHLQRSRDIHPSREQIELHCALAARADAGDTTFYLDGGWSGRSSAVLHDSLVQPKAIRVPTISVDSLFVDAPLPRRILFKIDVEGYESEVLAGMTRLLAEASGILGIVECNERFLADVGIGLDEFLDQLRSIGDLFAISSSGDLGAFDGHGTAESGEDVVVMRGWPTEPPGV
jgi:FkbM family methyltransferase